LNFIFSSLFVAALGACGSVGGCGGCGELPLPAPGTAPHINKMPADQTVEGGAQIRVTAAGFQKLRTLVPEAINGTLAPICIPKGAADIGIGIDLASYCGNTTPACGAGVKACAVQPSVAFTDLTPNGNNALNVRIGLNIDTTIPISVIFIGSCNLQISTTAANPDTPIIADLNLSLGIKRPDGELDIGVTGVNQIDVGGIDFISSGGIICDAAEVAGDLIVDILDVIGDVIGPLLAPLLNNFIGDLLPSPLGIAGMIDFGSMVEGVSPGTDALMEGRIVPGGFVSTNGGGLSLGVITGLNADQHPETRDIGLTSEPAKCVPPFLPPNLASPTGANLRTTSYVEGGTTVTRPTFTLPLAPEFNGSADAVGNPDLIMGISNTTLDLAGHHLVSSGGMCLGVGTNLIPQLNVGTIGILVPSVEELQSENGNDPLLLVTRPTRPLSFTINEDTATKAMTIHIEHLEVDFYAFLFERYTRAFTLDLTMNVDIGLTFEQTPTGAVIKPMLGGISAEQVTIKVLNSEFARETPADLEAVLPSVFDLVTPLLGDLPPISVPTFAGFTLENLSIARIGTTGTNPDDFLALKATLGANAALAQLNQQVTVESLQRAAERGNYKISPKAKLVRVTTPEPKAVRSALKRVAGGAMPQVVFDVDKVDAQGRELEWSYNLENGMFRPYAAAGTDGLVIADKAFAWQGKYEIGLKSRVKGDYTTTSDVIRTPVIIDSVGPRFLTETAAWDGDEYAITIFDIVSGNVVQWALGRPGERAPETAWFDGGFATIDRALLDKLALDGEVVIYSRDEAGNTNHARIAPFHGSPGEAGGCTNCNSSNPSTGGLVLMVLVGGLLISRRRRFPILAVARKQLGRPALTQLALFVGLSVTLSVVPGCSCGSASSCELFTDCPDCPEGEIAFCLDGTCACSDDILIGKLGAYSDVAAGADGSIWVSAYHNQYGDLVVAKVEPTVGRIPDTAWEWVDGVPDGPVIVPQSLYRRGIAAKGEDVGMYTSIQVSPDGTPQVTYFDRDTGSLKFAERNADGTWAIHVIEQGTGDLGSGEIGASGALIGMYTSLSVRSDNGFPGVAYLAHVADGAGRRAEVRFATSGAVHPLSSADWTKFVVDTAALPIEDENSPNIYPLPEGLGLFVDLARMPDSSPAIVYYDRTAGELKLSKFAGTAFGTPVVLDGAGDVDAGWSPSVGVDPNGVVHVAYVDATRDDLVYITDEVGAQRKIVDDGLRIVGTTVDGLPKPEYHFVGDDASLVLANAGQLPMIAYQDATTQELMLATQQQDGSWNTISLAGHTDPWPGAYGFFASDALLGTDLVISNWVINQPIDENWVEVFRRQVAIE